MKRLLTLLSFMTLSVTFYAQDLGLQKSVNELAELVKKYNSESKSQSANSNTSSSQPLYKGKYTKSGQGYCVTTGEYPPRVADLYFEAEFFSDYMLLSYSELTPPIKCNLVERTAQGERGYRDPNTLSYGGTSSWTTYYVDDNYNMRAVFTFSGPFGVSYTIFQVTKGYVNLPQSTSGNNVPYNNGTVGGSNSNNQTNTNISRRTTTPTQRVCITCHGDGKCNSCHGSGKRTDNSYGSGTNYAKTCGVCGGSGRCSVCRGTGHR